MTYDVTDTIVGYCSGHTNIDPDFWFSIRGDDITYAISLCNTRCPVKTACLDGARQRHERHGVWGGVKFGGRYETEDETEDDVA